MKTITSIFLSLAALLHAAGPPVLLDENGVALLGIETVEAGETVFEETAFALGHIEEIPENHAVLSSRIPGRIVEVLAREGDTVEAGQVIVRVESRQPGDPPPVIGLRAPLSGLVTESHVRLGEPVEPEKELLDISDLSKVRAIARVPEHQAGKLAPGSRARIRIAALGETVLEGTMVRFGTAANRAGGTIDAIFHLENPELRLRPGMRAEFDIVLTTDDAVLSVPKEAVQGTPANRHVFVKDFDIPNAFVRAPVRTGRSSGGRVEILAGIFPGDEVVTRGSYPLGFAGGGGGISLKEALDAAHGHEHNEDGSEMNDEQRKAAAAKTGGHPEQHAASPWRERFFMAATGILAVLLVISSLTRRKSSTQTADPA